MSEIPHTIHYCWFGGNSLGKKELACIDSWKKYLPGYAIVRWDESNFDVRSCDYASEAYDAKMWAFVSDYARFQILYDHGGLYFDTDVELIKPIDDILEAGPFMGFETDYSDMGLSNVAPGLDLAVNPGLGLAASPGFNLYQTILSHYQREHFVNPDGTLNRESVVFRVTKILQKLGLENKPGIQKVAGVTIYPAEYFNPKSYLTGEITITRNTRSIHHFSMSWFSDEEKYQHDVIAKLVRRGMSQNAAGHLSAIAATVKYCNFDRVAKHFRRGIDGK